MLVGKYKYDDDETNIYYVDYGFENIDAIEQYGEFMYEDTLKVTVLYGEKWNQYNVIDMKKVTQ